MEGLVPGMLWARGTEEGENVFEAEDRRAEGFEYACGDVAVNLVASIAERDILIVEQRLCGSIE